MMIHEGEAICGSSGAQREEQQGKASATTFGGCFVETMAKIVESWTMLYSESRCEGCNG